MIRRRFGPPSEGEVNSPSARVGPCSLSPCGPNTRRLCARRVFLKQSKNAGRATKMAEMTNPSETGGRLIAAGKVNGTTVYNTAGEKLGSVYDVMLDKISGRVEY